MSSAAQRSELQSQIWKIANEVRGSVDGWDFKQYVLGTLFYRFISENFSNYIEGGDESVHYAELDDKIITKEIIDDAIKTKGYFIYPSQLFSNIAKNANTNESLNTDLKAIFDAIENSASGYPSEKDIKGLFADFDTTSNRLVNTVKDKNTRLAAVIKGVEGLDFGNFEDNQIDLFGDAYEYLISNYAANAGKSGGEFFTPQSVSKLIAKLATHGQTTINKIYDPAAGSGSLLLQSVDILEERTIQDYRSTYNDIREWIRREREGKEKDNSKIDWDDVVFEVDLLKSQEINLDYILELIYEKNKNTKDKNTLIDEIRRIIRSSTGNRAKESLIIDFINQTDLDEIQDKVSIIDAFFQFAQKEQKREAEELIMKEKLNEEAAKRYILTSLRKEYASENGTDLNEILPRMSPLNPQYHTKKQSVFEKISAFVEKFKGVGGVI